MATTTYTTTTTGRSGFPIRNLFVPFPFVCFTLALITDIAYWRTSFMMWHNFSAWLLFAGLVFGSLGLVAGIFDIIRPSTRIWGPGWAPALGYIVVLALAILNSFIHAGDGWTAIVPNGMTVSAVTTLMIIATLWLAAKRRSSIIWSIER